MPDIPILPTDVAFAALDKAAQKKLLIDLLENFLDHAAMQGHELAAKEMTMVSYAISGLRLGSASSVMAELKRLITPTLQHGPGTVKKYPPGIAALRAELKDL